MNICHPIPEGTSWQLKSFYCPVPCGCHSHLSLTKQHVDPLHPRVPCEQGRVTGDHLCIQTMCIALPSGIASLPIRNAYPFSPFTLSIDLLKYIKALFPLPGD